MKRELYPRARGVPGLFFLGVALLVLLFAPWRLCVRSSAADWADWRGPKQDGTSPEKDLPDKFSVDPKDADSNLVWKAPYGGRSCPIVMNGRAYILNAPGGGNTPQAAA